MRKNRLSIFRNPMMQFVWLLIGLSCLMISGCATKLYSVNMGYHSGKANIPSYLKVDSQHSKSIALTGFTDLRKGDGSLVIGRVLEKNGNKKLIMPKYTEPTKAVTMGIENYLRKAGYRVSVDKAQWNLKEETLPTVGDKLVIGGGINELELTCRRGFPTDYYEAKIKLSIVLADAAKKKIIYQGSVESNSSLKHVAFSEEKLEQQINIVLGDAIEKMFEDKKLAQKLREAATD